MSIFDQSNIIKLEEKEVKPEIVIKQEKLEEFMESRKRNLDDEGEKKAEEESLNTCTDSMCTIHREQVQDDLLPETLKNMKNEDHGILELEKRWTCRYCGVKCFETDMRTVPTNKEQLSRWMRSLGQEFLKNVTVYKHNWICWSHFKKRRFINDLPMADEVEARNAIHILTEKCRYCDDVRKIEEMVLVSQNPLTFNSWVEKLGQKFFENIRNNSTNFICWSHFNLPYRLKLYYLKYLPHSKIESDNEIEVLNEEDVEKSRDERIPDIATLRDIVKNEPEENITSIEMPMEISNKRRKLDQGDKEELREREEKKICQYCGVQCPKKEMTSVPQKEERLLKWAELLGQQFLENVRRSTRNFICWRHFKNRDLNGRGVNNVPMRDEMLNSTISGLCGRKEPGNKTKSSSWRHRNFICRYCGAKCLKQNMTQVPKNEELLLKWSRILGEQFLENIQGNTVNFICWSHFKYRDAQARSVFNLPIPDETIRKMVEKTKSEHLNKKEDIIENEEKPDLETLKQTIRIENYEVEMFDLPNHTNASIEAEVEMIENDQKPDIETLQYIVKTEEKDDHHLDVFDESSVFLDAKIVCSTDILLDDENKPSLIGESE